MPHNPPPMTSHPSSACSRAPWGRCWPGRLASGLVGSPKCCRPEEHPERPDDLAIHVYLAPSWLDPSETSLSPPLYAAMRCTTPCSSPCPTTPCPSLATKWSRARTAGRMTSSCGRGEVSQRRPVYRRRRPVPPALQGSQRRELKQKVKAVEIVNAHHVRFHLHEPWPDFTTFYGTMATGWVDCAQEIHRENRQ